MPFQPFAHDWDRVQFSGSEQWRWLAVEIAEIRRCAAASDQAHDRLALLLIDHVVEVIVGREVNARLAWQPADSVVEELREIRDSGTEPDAAVDRLIDEHVGPDRRHQLDMHLHEKTKYLVKHDVLTFQEREVLDRMHEYRNAAYHRDTLEADLISDLVLAYMMLASQLLARHRPIALARGTTGPGELSALLVDGLEMDLQAVAGRFSEHAMKRVDDIVRAVDTARGIQRAVVDTAREQGDPMPDDDFAHLLTTLNGLTPKLLRSWAKRASGLKTNVTSLVNLMIRYIGLDRALDEIEPSARRLEIILDRWEQDRLDEIRGK
ncbi:hypothetical protein [Acrocarpospora sp. B8E8]|uniref:hypothetical protein n=1 Tax=Acrocarpospora sp. B8E8 TaxID=3153572 RepID=UPI00325D9183